MGRIYVHFLEFVDLVAKIEIVGSFVVSNYLKQTLFQKVLCYVKRCPENSRAVFTSVSSYLYLAYAKP